MEDMYKRENSKKRLRGVVYFLRVITKLMRDQRDILLWLNEELERAEDTGDEERANDISNIIKRLMDNEIIVREGFIEVWDDIRDMIIKC
jgi:hypothetical protein